MDVFSCTKCITAMHRGWPQLLTCSLSPPRVDLTKFTSVFRQMERHLWWQRGFPRGQAPRGSQRGRIERLMKQPLVHVLFKAPYSCNDILDWCSCVWMGANLCSWVPKSGEKPETTKRLLKQQIIADGFRMRCSTITCSGIQILLVMKVLQLQNPQSWKKHSSTINPLEIWSFISIFIYINISGGLQWAGNPKMTLTDRTWWWSRGTLFLLRGLVTSLQLGCGLFGLSVGGEHLPGRVQVKLPELLRQLNRLRHHALHLIIVTHLQREIMSLRVGAI